MTHTPSHPQRRGLFAKLTDLFSSTKSASDDAGKAPADYHPIRRRRNAGYTLLEVVIVLIVIGVLAMLVAPSVMAWVQASSAETCKSNQALVQTTMRAYAGLTKKKVGDNLAYTEFMGNQANHLIPIPKCPSIGGNNYTYGTTVPNIGTKYATCATQLTNSLINHVPSDTSTW
jgi:prepilin-type N-terminal cleavage/methylation domain